jgi:hypothetical protein
LDVESLLARRPQLQDAVLASAATTRRVLGRHELAVREVGVTLFTALLGTGGIAGLFRASAAIAAEREHRLRITLRIKTPELADLPWEATYDEMTGSYVCRPDQLVRYLPVSSLPAPLTVTPPCASSASSSAKGLPALDADKELRRRLVGHAYADGWRGGGGKSAVALLTKLRATSVSRWLLLRA